MEQGTKQRNVTNSDSLCQGIHHLTFEYVISSIEMFNRNIYK